MAEQRPPGEHEYVERMFAAPVDLGIAEEERAVSSVASSTQSFLEGAGGAGESWWQGGGAVGDRAVQGITVYPPTRGLQTQGDPFEPVKIGVLIDMDLGQLLADWLLYTSDAADDLLCVDLGGRSPVSI